RVDVKGEGQNKEAIGATVELWSAGSYQILEKHLSRGYISSVEPIIHFGLGNTSKVDSVRITWPYPGKQIVITNPGINRVLRVSSKDAKPVELKQYRNPSAPFFSRADHLFPFEHSETDYVDFFQGQSVMQHKFSMNGPVMETADLDGNGSEEILVAGGFGYPSEAYHLIGGKYISFELPGWTGVRSAQVSGMVIVDIDGDADQDIIEIAGGYSQEDASLYTHHLFRNNKGVFVSEKLPVPSFVGSVVREMDFDKDGDIDLFIGNRVSRRNFPFSDNSWLLINNGNSFKAEALPLEMVTDAAWTDTDGDGWKDLVVTRELNYVAWLKNESGKKLVLTEKPELTSMHGFWESVTAADFDLNGSEDLILGNLGHNHRFTISDEYPFRVYGIDVDKNGVVDPVCTSYWKDKEGLMQEYPVNYMDELFAQSPYFRKLFTSYTTFSYSDMSKIYKTDTIKSARVRFANYSASVIVWNDKGSLSVRELPAPLQNTPLTKTLVHDFTGDGTADVLICGNDHSFDVSTGNYDAGRGMILTVDRERNLRVMAPAATGLSILGQVRSLNMIRGSENLVLIGINRKPAKVYKINKAEVN
ncbi:MAG: FG-GAP-like repeat-containing protein, partial [Cyclobacteriaceae bacterium]